VGQPVHSKNTAGPRDYESLGVFGHLKPLLTSNDDLEHGLRYVHPQVNCLKVVYTTMAICLGAYAHQSHNFIHCTAHATATR